MVNGTVEDKPAILVPRGKKLARMVIFHADDVENENDFDWKPVHPDKVPNWLKDPDIIADMIDQHIFGNEDEGWYTAELCH